MSVFDALDRVAKWRLFFASWQMGTQPDSHGPTRAVKHHREATILLRVEVSALIQLLIGKGIITQEEWEKELEAQADALNKALAEAFPGWSATDDGMKMELPAALVTQRTLGFPR